MSLDQAIEAMLAYAAVNPSIETIATLDADQRVLAQDIHSEIQVPAFDNSAMDGYAFTHADLLPQQSNLGEFDFQSLRVRYQLLSL